MKLQNKQNKKELEIYVHIPFCIKKCEYCDFLSGPANREQIEKYMNALIREIYSVSSKSENRVVSVFIGGGTPSLIDPCWIEKLMDVIREAFIMEENAEISIEANPGTLTEEKLKSYLKAGINRISIGLQSTNDQELKMLGRIHTFQQFLDNYQLARKVGFRNINIDLISAIPEQTYDQWIANLQRVAKLGPEHISAYSLIVEEGTPFYEKELRLPDEETEYIMYEDTWKILKEYGYIQYEISNYSREGFQCRHNVGYWKRCNYLGLGLGASSLIDNCRYSNTRDMKQYLECSNKPESLRENIEYLSKEDQMEEFMFLGLRMREGISRRDFQSHFQCEIDEIYKDVIEKYKKTGLLLEENGRIFLSREGIHVSNQIMADFLL